MCRPSFARYSSESSPTPLWKLLHMTKSFCRSSAGTSTSAKILAATASKASLGHSRNQSMVQQLTRDGNCRSRSLNASPMGEKQRMMCRLALQLAMK